MAISFAVGENSCAVLRKLMDTVGNMRPRVFALRSFTEMSIGTMRLSSLSICRFQTSRTSIPSAVGAVR